jgi:DNA-binding response OmpR family regulator
MSDHHAHPSVSRPPVLGVGHFAVHRQAVIRFADAAVDANTLRLIGRTGEVSLSVTEYKLLLAVLQSPSWRIPKSRAAVAVWNHSEEAYEASDTYRKCSERLTRLLVQVGSSLAIGLRDDTFALRVR